METNGQQWVPKYRPCALKKSCYFLKIEYSGQNSLIKKAKTIQENFALTGVQRQNYSKYNNLIKHLSWKYSLKFYCTSNTLESI